MQRSVRRFLTRLMIGVGVMAVGCGALVQSVTASDETHNRIEIKYFRPDNPDLLPVP